MVKNLNEKILLLSLLFLVFRGGGGPVPLDDPRKCATGRSSEYYNDYCRIS